MEDTNSIDQIEIGRCLAHVRERANMKQSKLAGSIDWSPALLSRIENGERPVSDLELKTILDAIGTPESLRLQQAVHREWLVLPRPPFDHPDQDILWSAEEVMKDLISLRQQPDVRSAFEHRLTEYITEISDTAEQIRKLDYQIAFIGSIGIGKSTAICRAANLEVPIQDGQRSPVLEAGAGGITICEVHLRTGPVCGIVIEARSDEEIRADVTDFAEYIVKGVSPQPDELQEGEGESQGISKEIERAVRNMSGLKIRRERNSDGKRTSRDEAKELGLTIANVRAFAVDVLDRMQLHKRDRRSIWYDTSYGKSQLMWLRDTFEEINNGRHSEFTLPKRIEVVVESQLLGVTDLALRIIDTKGIDRTEARADLENHLYEPHTLTVLCSGFNDAPGANPRMLLERAKDTGVRTLKTHTSLLVLPRMDEALAVKDESGIRVESIADGYELKHEQIAMSLQPLGMSDIAINFFNSRQDDPEELRRFLHERIAVMRETFRTHISEVIGQAHNLLVNHEQQQVQEVIHQAAGTLRSWSEQNTTLEPLRMHVHDSLMDQIASAHASTIRATVRREGEWPNLSYTHQLGHGARRVAALSLGTKVQRFAELCTTLAGNPELAEAQDLLNQAERVLVVAYEDLLRKVQLMGQTSFRDELKIDSEFWLNCANEWGRGPGYRNRIAQHNDQWFSSHRGKEIEYELADLIQREWAHALSRMARLLEYDE